MKYIESINSGLSHLLTDDPAVYVVGEDLLDPYGGAFKATRGLSTKFPDRIISTPISEAGFVGLATGMALRGLRPVVEIMFGDFIALAADQIINGAAKLGWLYEINVPLVIRLPGGGYRGYGATHSQTLETLFLNIPLVDIVAPSVFHNPGECLYQTVRTASNPTLFVEPKYLYSKELLKGIPPERTELGNGLICIDWGGQNQIAVIAYGGMASLAHDAVVRAFMSEEIEARLIVPLHIKPTITEALVLASACALVPHIVIVEESSLAWGWGAEIAYQLQGLAKITRIGAAPTPIPCAPDREAETLPSVERITDAILGRGS